MGNRVRRQGVPVPSGAAALLAARSLRTGADSLSPTRTPRSASGIGSALKRDSAWRYRRERSGTLARRSRREAGARAAVRAALVADPDRAARRAGSVVPRPLDTGVMNRLFTELGAEEFRVRERAERTLAEMGTRAEPALRIAVTKSESPGGARGPPQAAEGSLRPVDRRNGSRANGSARPAPVEDAGTDRVAGGEKALLATGATADPNGLLAAGAARAPRTAGEEVAAVAPSAVRARLRSTPVVCDDTAICVRAALSLCALPHPVGSLNGGNPRGQFMKTTLLGFVACAALVGAVARPDVPLVPTPTLVAAEPEQPKGEALPDFPMIDAKNSTQQSAPPGQKSIIAEVATVDGKKEGDSRGNRRGSVSPRRGGSNSSYCRRGPRNTRPSCRRYGRGMGFTSR